MSLANQRQPGGNHYAAAIQHWDVIEHHGIGYLEAAATKYLTRLDKKGTPLLDAEKPGHYVEKLIELHDTIGRGPRGHVPAPVIAEFLRANGVDGVRGAAITLLLGRWTVETLRVAADLIDAILVDVRQREKAKAAGNLDAILGTIQTTGLVDIRDTDNNVIPWPLSGGRGVEPSPNYAAAETLTDFLAQNAPVAGADPIVQAVRQERGKDPLPRKDTHAVRLEDDGTGELKARAVPVVPRLPATIGVDDFDGLRPALRELYTYDGAVGEFVLKPAFRQVA